MNPIASNLNEIKKNIEASGGDPNQVEILGVTKFQPPEKIREALGAGVKILGNNYAQEGDALKAAFPEADVRWHFIGHIQSRKLKYLPAYDRVQSLDRLDLAEALEARLAQTEDTLEVLVEINVGAESQKSGIAIEAFDSWLTVAKRWKHLRWRGLMTMPPPLWPVEERRPYFKIVRSLYDAHRLRWGFDCLSMGTSSDYRIAIEEGSNMLRLGEILFGARPDRN